MIKKFNEYKSINENNLPQGENEWGENGDLDYLMIVRYPSTTKDNVRVERITLDQEEINEIIEDSGSREKAISDILSDHIAEVEQGFGKAVILNVEEAEEMVMKLHPNY